jgi:hypothetical protein
LDSKFDEISDNHLDDLVWQYYCKNPAGGCSYVIGCLCAVHSLHIQCQRVINSMNCFDQLGQGLRQCLGKKKEWGSYHVPRPNALWHIDGHHKLIAWEIVIHGVADGYSRTVSIELYHPV